MVKNMGFFKATPGTEVRGLMIRLYPDAKTIEALESLERDSRMIWNWLVSQTEEVIAARQAYAIKHGLVSTRPVRPNYDGMQPTEAKAAAAAHRVEVVAWHNAVHAATDKVPGCEYRKLKDLIAHFGVRHDYQLMMRYLGWKYEEGDDRPIKPNSWTLQSLVKNYLTKGGRRKKFRKKQDRMPLQTRSGDCFKIGDFGSRGRSVDKDGVVRGHRTGSEVYYNCQVTFNGLKIKGRLPGKSPEGRVLEGVSIRKQADGWWASIKCERPIPAAVAPVPGSVCGIDVGLDYIAVVSEVRVVTQPEEAVYSKQGEKIAEPIRIQNPRGKAYSERIAGRQAQGKDTGRLQLAASRHVRHLIHNQIIKPLVAVETIKVEKLSGHIGQMGSSKQSFMRSAIHLLTQRRAESVREVQPHFTSQDCSQCGHRSKESWSYENGRVGHCPACGYQADRDLNASRNIAAKLAIPLAS